MSDPEASVGAGPGTRQPGTGPVPGDEVPAPPPVHVGSGAAEQAASVVAGDEAATPVGQAAPPVDAADVPTSVATSATDPAPAARPAAAGLASGAVLDRAAPTDPVARRHRGR